MVLSKSNGMGVTKPGHPGPSPGPVARWWHGRFVSDDMAGEVQKFCTTCGVRLTPGSSFCGSCGSRVATMNGERITVENSPPVTEMSPAGALIPFQRAGTGLLRGRLCTLVLTPAGIIVAGMAPGEEKQMAKLSAALDSSLEVNSIDEGEGFWEVAGDSGDLSLPPFVISPLLEPSRRKLFRDVLERLDLKSSPWARYGRMDQESILREDRKNIIIPYGSISQVCDFSDDPDSFGLLAGDEEYIWACEAHTYSMVKSALSAAVYNATTRQAGLNPDTPEAIGGIIPGCENITAGNLSRGDCIVTPLRMVFIDPRFGSWEKMSEGWFTDTPGKKKSRILARFEEVTGTTWVDGSEKLVTSAAGGTPESPWEDLLHSPVQTTINQSRGLLMVPVGNITGITLSKSVSRPGGLFYLQKVPVDKVSVLVGNDPFSFDLPPGSAEYAADLLSGVLPGKVTLT
jgi:hypothetical protein